MWRRTALYLALALLALLVVVVPGVIVIGGRTGWARARLHEAVTAGLADYVQREVAVGPVSGSILDGITVESIAIAEGAFLRDGAMLTTGRVRVSYDLWSVLRGRMTPLASISTVEVWEPRVRMVHDRQGRLNLAKLLPRLQMLPPDKRFRGRVIIHDGALLYEDYGPRLLRPLVARADQLQINADLRRITQIAAEVRGRILDGRAGDFAGALQVRLDGTFSNFDLTLAGLDVPWLAGHFRGVAGRFPGGRLDLNGSLYNVRYQGKPQSDYSVALRMRHVQVATQTQGLATVGLDGEAWLSRAGLRAQGLRATVAGSTYTVSGSMGAQKTPLLDVALVADNARLGPLMQALPRGARRAVDFPRGGVGRLSAQIIGPVSNPDLRLRLDAQDELTIKLANLGTIHSDGLSLRADIISASRQPSLRAQLSAGRLEVPAIKLAASENPHLPRSVAIGPMRGLRATVQVCGSRPVGEAVVQTPYVRAGDFRATDVSTRLVLVNDLLRLQNLRANAMGAKITADASLLTTQPQAGLRARGAVRGLDLARLQELPGVDVPEGLAGIVNADFQAHVAKGRLAANASFNGTDLRAEGVTAQTANGVLGLEAVEGKEGFTGVGRVSVKHAQREDLALDSAEALVRFSGKQLEILSGVAQAPEGTAWARGEVDLEAQTLHLRVQAANLALDALARRAGAQDIQNVKGRAYATGDLTGPFKQPVFDGRLTVFNPEANGYALSALTARARYEYQQDRLALNDLMATRGGAIVSGDLTLTNLSAPRNQIAVDGHLSGESVDLADVARLLKQDRPLAGIGEFTADLSGTLEHPRAQGHLQLAHLTYDDLVISEVTAPFVLDDQRLTVHDVRAVVLDAPVQVRGTMTLGEHPELDAYLNVGELRLEGLGPYLDTALPLAGKASVERAWVRGPLDELQGGARITAQRVMVGDETLGDLDATLSLSHGQLQLQETSFDIANGRVILSGAYDTAAEPNTITAHVQLLQTNLADLLYLALPIASTVQQQQPAAERDRLLRALRSYALRFRGAVDGSVNVAGPISAPTAAVDLQAERLVLDGRVLPQLTAQGSLSRHGVENLVLAARQGNALINASGDIVFDGPINLDVEGTGIAMAQLRPWTTLDTPFAGQLGFTVVASGLTREPELMASVDIAQPSFAGVQFDVLSVPLATVREGEIDVDTLTIKRGETAIVLDGRLPFSWHVQRREGSGPGLIPDGQVTMGGRIENTPLAFFMPLVDEYRRGQGPPAPGAAAEDAFNWASVKTEGKVNSAVTVTGTVKQRTLRGYLKLDDGLLQPKTWSKPLREVKADVQFSGMGASNRIEVNTLTARYDQTRADLGGWIAPSSFRLQDLWRNAMDLRLKLAADKQTLPGGTELADLRGALTMRTESGAQVLRPEDLKVKVGGGQAEFSGEARFRQFRLARLADNDYDLHLKLEPGRVRIRPYLDALVKGRLDLITPSGETQAKITGDWQLSQGLLGLEASAAGVSTFKAFSSAFPAPGLDIVLGLGKDMRLRGSSVKAPLKADPVAAHLTGTPQRPTIVGNATTGHGTTILPTATLHLRTLAVRYFIEPVPGERSDPQTLRLRGSIDGAAETTISRPGMMPVHIQVRISGYLPDQVAITTTSEPPLAESQIYALLGGVPFSYLPGVGTNEAGLGQVVSEQFLAALGQVFQLRVFGPIEDELQKVLGIELGITFTFNQPVTLQVGKYVLRNLFISYERPLAEATERYDLRVSYELPHGLRITYHNDERNINQIEIGYSFTY